MRKYFLRFLPQQESEIKLNSQCVCHEQLLGISKDKNNKHDPISFARLTAIPFLQDHAAEMD